MTTAPVRLTVASLAAAVSGEIVGEGQLELWGVGRLEDAEPGQLSFFANQRYREALGATRASAVLVPRDFVGARAGLTVIRVDQPHLAFARVAQLFHPAPRPAPGMAPRATVHPSAQVAASATIMDGATVSADAVVGERAVLFPGVYLGEGARVGDDTVLRPNVAVMNGCTIGARCLVHPNAVIGADGFGFALDLSVPEHVKIPQVGVVRVEDDVEIGACSCIDRATTGETVVGRGTKIDNLVQVGHNSTIGPLSILCAQVGLSGSTALGMGVMMGGQAGSAGHQHIGDMAKVAARAAVLGDLEAGATVAGAPAFAHKDWLRATSLFSKLPTLHRQLRELERRLAALEKEPPK